MQLLAIVQVDVCQRVYCQAPECTRTVYKEIHVIEDKGEILVLGSFCYTKLYGQETVHTSVFTGTRTRMLTESERELLHSNTKALIDKFKKELPVQDIDIQDINIQDIDSSNNNVNTVAVKCSYCHVPMQTTLKKKPARGYRCQECKSTGLTDGELRKLIVDARQRVS